MHHVYVWCLQRPEESIGSPGTGVQIIVGHGGGGGAGIKPRPSRIATAALNY